jgi:hypothetical protein
MSTVTATSWLWRPCAFDLSPCEVVMGMRGAKLMWDQDVKVHPGRL